MEYRFGHFCLDTDRLELHGIDGAIEIEPQVFALLALLVENSDRVVEKDQIIDHVWHGRIVSDANLNSRVNAARKAVGDDGKAQSVIRTFPRRGFRFVAELNVAELDAVATFERSDRARVLVLPFQARSTDPEMNHVADGLTEDIILQLCRSKQIVVLSRAVTFTYRDEATDLQALQRDHGVKYVVEGSLRKLGAHLRVSALLSETQSGGVLWSEQLDGEDDDPFAMMDQVTRRVAAAVEPTLKRMERKQAAESSETNPRAWDFYLRGNSHLLDDGIIGQVDMAHLALDDFRKAIELDPKLAEAHGGIAHALWHMVGFSFAADRAQRMQEALKHARIAAELAPDNAETMSELGIILVHMKRTEDGLSMLRRAVELNPNDPLPRLYIGIGLVGKGDTQEALRQLEIVQRIGKQHVSHGAALAWSAMALNFEQRYVEAEPLARGAVANPHTQFWANISLILSLLHQGKTEEAIERRIELEAFKLNISCATIAELTPITKTDFLDTLLSGLLEVGLPPGE